MSLDKGESDYDWRKGVAPLKIKRSRISKLGIDLARIKKGTEDVSGKELPFGSVGLAILFNHCSFVIYFTESSDGTPGHRSGAGKGRAGISGDDNA